MLVDEGHQFALTHGTGVLVDDFAVLVNEDGRNTANVVFSGNGVVFIDVVLANHGLAFVLRGGQFQRRSQHTARTAPRCPEVDKDGLAGDGLDVRSKGGVGNVNDVFAHDDLFPVSRLQKSKRSISEILREQTPCGTKYNKNPKVSASLNRYSVLTKVVFGRHLKVDRHLSSHDWKQDFALKLSLWSVCTSKINPLRRIRYSGMRLKILFMDSIGRILAMRHFLKFADFTRDELNHMLKRALWIKAQQKAGTPYTPFVGKVLLMIFEKASTRTRVSFEAGFYQMGGNVIHLSSQGSQLGRSESIEDTARVVTRMVDLVMIRTFGQDRLQAFADNSKVPVINGLTNEYHPVQIMTDIMTFMEHKGSIEGKTVCWVGDANNMSYSWLEAAKILGFHINLAIPEGYDLDLSLIPEGNDYYTLYRDPLEAAKGADLVTTDVWTSMGFEEENAKRRKDFADYQVDSRVMAAANPGALFMHCLPAHRGEEVTADVIDGPQSVVFDEAENRLHAQKGVMEFCLLGKVD